MIGRRQAIGRLGGIVAGILAALGLKKAEATSPRAPVDTYDEIGVLEFSTKDGTLRRCWTDEQERTLDRSDRTSPARRLFEPIGPDAAKLQPFTVHRNEPYLDAGYAEYRSVGPLAEIAFDDGARHGGQPVEVMPDRRLRLRIQAVWYAAGIEDVRIVVPYLVNYRKA